jgi:hypothetical protein
VHTARTVSREPSQALDVIALPVQSPTAFEHLTGAQYRSRGFGDEWGAGPWINDPTWTQDHDYAVLDEIVPWCNDNDHDLPLLQQVENAQSMDEFANLFYTSDYIQDLNGPDALLWSSCPTSHGKLSASDFHPLQAFSFHLLDKSQTRTCSTADVGIEQLQNYGGTANLAEQGPGMIAWPGHAFQLESSQPGAVPHEGFDSEKQIYNPLRSGTGQLDYPSRLVHQVADEQQVPGITKTVSRDVSHDVDENLNQRHPSFAAKIRLDSDALGPKSRIERDLGAPGLNSSSASMADSGANSYLSLTLPTAAPLPVIFESGRGGPQNISSLFKPPGRRSGPLPKAKAVAIAKTRKAKNVCIRCQQMRVSVSHVFFTLEIY